MGTINFYVQGKALEQLASESKGNDDRRLATVSSIPKPIIHGQIAQPARQQIAQWMSGVEIRELEHPRTWRLLTGPSEHNETEEIVFTVVGVVCTLDLPPVLQRHK